MAEIKVEEGLTSEIAGLRSAGKKVAGNKPSLSSASSLPACEAYRERCRALGDVLELFGKLVAKDAGEIQEFVDKMKNLDNS